VIVHGTVSGQVATKPSGIEDALPPLPGDRAEITTKFEPSLTPSPGDRLRLGMGAQRVHIFDGRTGDAIVPPTA
jgi:hypothetical protein